MFGGDSDPGVLNRNIKDGAVAQQFRGADAQFDGAAIREFHRVVEQVQNNLPDAAEIAHHAPAGNARVIPERQALGLQLRRHQLAGFAHAIDDIKRSSLNFHSAGFDCGKIQNVIDDGQQTLRGSPDGLREFSLLGLERAVEQEIGHSRDAVHGCPHFVAHTGEKLTFGAVGRLRRDFSPLQFGRAFRRFPLGALALRNVPRNAQDGGLSVIIE